ncbi:MAG TPA: UDP-N-acetylmuramoyl-L-alanine--D-glutamate ligase [Vicinamibacterales bacterium]|jgi:UDP-N-acetylmuramoylalanine--D-glutamate ligase|nr:UDP-N-acetylmuramoyl-L-alanine--D-glutamate ligase [Vicinamibacterales bacterium]
MTTPFSVDRKRVVVVGAARSGVAAAELLVRRGAIVTLTDARTDLADAERLRARGVLLALGGHHEAGLSSADLIVLSPGVSPRQADVAAARDAGVPVIGELELASRWLRGRIVAITGTKGKSTTTTLTGRMLDAAGFRVLVGGNIGLALSAQVDESTDETIHVIETSSFQLETTETFHPWIAVLLNFSPDHLDRHTDVQEYAAAKARIFANQTERDWAVINADDQAVLAMASAARSRRLAFSMAGRADADVRVEDAVIVRRHASATEPLVPLSSVRLLGRHLVADVLAASAVASLCGADPAAMTRAVEAFTGLEHALEPVAEVGGVRFVNDSKATNIEAALRAIESFDGPLVVIVGGRFKGGRFADLEPALRARRATVISIGEAAPLVEEALAGSVAVHRVRSMADAVRTGFVLAHPGETVLLAPACASFDMFRDYAERGRVFKQEVSTLGSHIREGEKRGQ